LMHAAVNDLSSDVVLAGARMLLLAVSDCQALYLFGEAEQYRCDGIESTSADLIAEPSDLGSLPDSSFDLVVANGFLATWSDVEQASSEVHRVLVPGGKLLLLAPGLFPKFLPDRFAVRTVPSVDPVTRTPGNIHVGRKDAPPLDAPSPVTELSGYAYHLSRKSGRRIVFCLAGSTEDQLPVLSESGEVVGQVALGPYSGGYASPAEPWKEGFCLPPRGTFNLDPSLPSGVYSLEGKIPFVHRREHGASVAVLLPSNTASAFNPAGGRRLYETAGEPPTDVLSFHRPLEPEILLSHCRPFVKWFASENPYARHTTYLIDSDLESPHALHGVEVLIVIGRSEYWTRAMREHFDAFIDRGGRALLLSSEVMYWQVRVDLARHQMYRWYIQADPHPDPLLRTTLWSNPSLRYPVYPRVGCERWYGGISADHDGIGWGGMRIATPDSPLLKGSGLAKGDVVALPDAVTWDGAPVKRGTDGVPQVDFGDAPPWRHEVIGYNLAKVTEVDPLLENPATSLWIVLRRTPDAGTVIHGGTMGWCGRAAMQSGSPHSDLIRSLILRMLSVLVDDIWPFSYSLGEEELFRPGGTASAACGRVPL
jgi:SAM-dependent methyltransferase